MLPRYKKVPMGDIPTDAVWSPIVEGDVEVCFGHSMEQSELPPRFGSKYMSIRNRLENTLAYYVRVF